MGANEAAGERTDVLVIGAGQAGLATARALEDAGVTCIVHERHARIGDSWRRRFDSLVLFTPRELDALPGLRHEGDPRGYPGKDEMGDYLERYAARFDLPVVTGDGVERLVRDGDRFVARTASGRRIDARSVVVATGTFQRPRIPRFAERLSETVHQLDAERYRNPSTIAGRSVAVVGDGATGRQIALELAQAGKEVMLATGRRRRYVPQRVLGRDFTWWGVRLGLVTADKSSPAGRLVRAMDATPGLHLLRGALRRAGVALCGRCVGADGDRLLLEDGRSRRCDAVVWTLGYRDDTSWLDIPRAATADGFVEERGIAPIPGLFHVGREWQSSRASGLICGVQTDVRRIVGDVIRDA
ncbi:MAG TPA: NAD(P)/FAD-dependent oxidoreductase [Gammaproteobacteria bacterium]